jgi:AcrR family transcriptional regulator
MNREAIAEIGIEIADADGLGAVTMERVAAALGFSKMALYRYVPGKVELIALMTDTALGEPPRLWRVRGGWRPKLVAWCRRIFERFMEHPWALETTTGARIMGPNELGWLEQAVGALSDTGLDGSEMLDLTVTLVGQARSIAQQTVGTADAHPEQAIHIAISTLLRGREGRFPALSVLFASDIAPESQDQALDFGLHRILDGVELLIAARAGHVS